MGGIRFAKCVDDTQERADDALNINQDATARVGLPAATIQKWHESHEKFIRSADEEAADCHEGDKGEIGEVQ